MESKFTKGPWRLMKHVSTGIESESGRFVATAGSYSDGTEESDLENKANSRLIKSSPELLEALQQGVELMEYLINATPTGKVRDTMCDFNIIARAAIAKALGLF